MTGNSELRSSDEQLDKLLGGAYESALGLDWDLEVGDVLGASGRPRRGRVRTRVGVVLVAAAILVVFFVPFPRLSVFDRLSHQTSTSPGVSSTTTTTRPRVSNATTKQIDAFVARASHGLSERFRASYEITEPVAGGRTSSSLENVAQLSYPQHFMYERYGGGSGHLSEFFFGPTQSPRDAGTFGIYTCARASLRASWSCGLLGEGMAGSMLMADYLPAAMFTGLQALAGQGSAVAFDRIVAGRQMSCLKFGSGNAGEGGTVCLTAGGVIGYESSQLVSNPEFEGTATLRTLSFDVLPEQLDLPATVFVARCRSEGLRVSAHQASGAVGSEAVLIVFENASVSSCEMKGYPTAWFVSSSGKRLGPKSGHESAPAPSTVFLPPGDTASATVWTQNPGVPKPSYCVPVTPAGIRVVPPDQAGSLVTSISHSAGFALPVKVCSAHTSVEITPVVVASAQGPS